MKAKTGTDASNKEVTTKEKNNWVHANVHVSYGLRPLLSPNMKIFHFLFASCQGSSKARVIISETSLLFQVSSGILVTIIELIPVFKCVGVLHDHFLVLEGFHSEHFMSTISRELIHLFILQQPLFWNCNNSDNI